MGWRQSDTQSIAINFVRDGFDLAYPRIDWGGDGPGIVEAELPLYSALVGAALAVFGFAEWPGQVLSLACLAGVALLLWHALRPRFGAGPAVLAFATFLTAQSTLFLSTSVQPDSLSLLFYTAGFVCFLSWMGSGSRAALGAAAVATALSGLVKPTSLHLGVTQFLLVVALRRDALRQPLPWLSWAGVLAVNGAWLVHGAALHAEYGNTFGVVSGGDSKFPTPEMLLVPGQYWALLRTSITWGVGPLGFLAAVFLAVTRRIGAVEWCLAAGNVLLLVVALRYTSNPFLGSHYHATTSILGAWLVAHAAAVAIERWGRERALRLGLPVAATATLVLWGVGLRERVTLGRDWADGSIVLARELADRAEPRTLTIVRSAVSSKADAWGSVNNYEDPRIFYVADVRGWVLAPDAYPVDEVEEAWRRGARFYVDPTPELADHAPLLAWLDAHGERVVARPEGRIWRLDPAP
jgi:hypothetical protein